MASSIRQPQRSEEVAWTSVESSSSSQDQSPDLIQISESESSTIQSSIVTPPFGSSPKSSGICGKSRDNLSQRHRPELDEQYTARKRFLDDLNNFVAVGSLILIVNGDDTSDQQTCTDEWLESIGTFDQPLSSEKLPESMENAGPVCSRQDQILIQHLLSLGWIRVFVKRCRPSPFAIIRIYVLPDDAGRGYVKRDDGKRSSRTQLKHLIARLDISNKSWQGYPIDNNEWKTEAITDRMKNIESEGSLFYIFNTIPAPDPTRRKVDCPFSRLAISSILDGSINRKGLCTELYPFQKRSAATMIQREVQPAHTLDPRLEPIEGPLGNTFYYDRASGVLCRERRTYEEACGGILGETMGLGKTLICLAVVLATKGHWPQVPPEYSLDRHPVRHKVGTLAEMAASAIGRARIPWKTFFQDLAKAGEHHDRCIALLEKNIGSYIIPSPQARATRNPSTVAKLQRIRLCTATLIVVPLNLFTQWQNEISAHVEEDTLSILTVQALDTPIPSEDELLNCDIILISKQRFEREMKPLEINPTTAKRSIPCICSSAHNCSCAAAGPKYHSTLRKLHFLRIIVDEGHQFASSGGTNNMIWALQRLRVDRRWIVSGTPSAGLIGAEVALAANETSSATGANNVISNIEAIKSNLERLRETRRPSHTTPQTQASEQLQEYKDVQKLGRIVVDFLGIRPWANTGSEDPASWKQYVMPTRGGVRKPRSLRGILESLVIRHRIEDIEKDIELPLLHNKVVYLKPSWHDKLSINLFLLNLIANAVTSERCDEDYMFHPKNRQQLNKLITNLRYSGFYWTSHDPQDIVKTLEVSQKYLDQPARTIRSDSGLKAGDAELLKQAIAIGQTTLEAPSWSAFALLYEIGLYVEKLPLAACKSWSLLRSGSSEPLLVGATQLAKAQRFVDSHLYASDLEQRFAQEGESVMQKIWHEATINNSRPATSVQGFQPRQTPKKKVASSSNYAEEPKLLSKHTFSKARFNASPQKPPQMARASCESTNGSTQDAGEGLKSALKASSQFSPTTQLPPDSPFGKTKLCGTASAKLSYLLDRILDLQTEEKSLVFYEGNHIAYYIAQAFEILNIRFLIYTGSLATSRKNAYIHTFNTSETFRVMLMDLRQAAHGLHVASASRVFFVNPVWQPNVEAQAIKRAHRIGQRRPVFVETLILENTLEHKMLERRKAMTAPEHIHAERSLVDDPVMSDLIKEATFIPTTAQEATHPKSQMAPLQQSQPLFGRMSNTSTNADDPDVDIIFPDEKDFKRRQRNRTSSESLQYSSDKMLSPMPRERRELTVCNNDDLQFLTNGNKMSRSSNLGDLSSIGPQSSDSPSPTELGPVVFGPSMVSHSATETRVSFERDEPATDGNAGLGVASGLSESQSHKRLASESLGGSSKRVAFSLDEPLAQSGDDTMHDIDQDVHFDRPQATQPRSLFGNTSKLA